MSDYLWDRTGRVDPEVAHLEALLGGLRHRGRAPAAAEPARRRWVPAAIAAMLLAGVALTLLRSHFGERETRWQIASVEGAVSAPRPSSRLKTGQAVITDATGHVTLEAETFGRVEIGPESELRAVASGASRETLSLARGTIHALIWAPPRQFVVDTPSSRAIDLGCQYTLTVDPHGDGIVTVQSGWVAFQFDGREAFIPAGAACRTTRQHGPGTPYFEDATETLRAAVASYDALADPDDLGTVLAEARPRDGLTLWHLLSRVPETQRGAVFDRFQQLVPVPPEVTRAAVLRKDPRALDLCWNALNLENADWWREWKRDWRQ